MKLNICEIAKRSSKTAEEAFARLSVRFASTITSYYVSVNSCSMHAHAQFPFSRVYSYIFTIHLGKALIFTLHLLHLI